MPAPSPAPKFTTGSTMRHVVVMTATGSIGLMAIFLVDFLNLFYIAMLGQAELAAAIGYAGTLLFFTISLCIGISIAGTALVSRALGARRREEARRLATSSLVFMTAVTLGLTLITLPLLSPILSLFGATGRTLDIAWRFLLIVMPTTPLMGLAMACSGLLRAAGDARRAMYVTLAGGLVTAACDPLLIFGLGLGVDGAAITSILARLAMVALGFHGCLRVHDLLAPPDRRAARADARPLAAIAVPAVLANIATPFGNAIVTAAIARYGDSAVAGYAVIGRIVPLAFGAIFALAGSIGPILGQNFGAGRFDRVRGTVRDGMTFTTLYCVAMCVVLLMLREPIVRAFGVAGEGADLIRFFCMYLSWSWIAVGWLFVANAAFNNLGFPTWSTVFNWGRATVGTVPFVWIGATQFGAAGVIAGQGAGGVAFAIGAVVVCFRVIGKLAAHRARAPAEEVASAAEVPPFASEKAATAIEWAEPDDKAK